MQLSELRLNIPIVQRITVGGGQTLKEVKKNTEKNPCIATGVFFLRAPVNRLDGLDTAALFAAGYRTDTKSFSPHWRISFQSEDNWQPFV